MKQCHMCKYSSAYQQGCMYVTLSVVVLEKMLMQTKILKLVDKCYTIHYSFVYYNILLTIVPLISLVNKLD